MTIRKQQAKAAKRYKREPTKLNLNRLHKLNMMLLRQTHSSIVDPFDYDPKEMAKVIEWIVGPKPPFNLSEHIAETFGPQVSIASQIASGEIKMGMFIPDGHMGGARIEFKSPDSKRLWDDLMKEIKE